MKQEVTLFWFRRDLRLQDNAALHHALRCHKNVLPVFLFDSEILSKLEDKHDRRVDFIHQAVTALNDTLSQNGSALLTFYGSPRDVFMSLAKKYQIKAVYANEDYEPYARHRDEEVRFLFSEQNIEFKTYKDQCIFEKDEVMKDDGKPYTVFTPYSKKWKQKLNPFFYKAYPVKKYSRNFFKCQGSPVLSLKSIGFKKTEIAVSDVPVIPAELLRQYGEQRNFPAIYGTSRLSVHLRFGTVSIRQLVAKSIPLSETWLNELIWRDFYMMILWHFPHVAHQAFKKEYDHIPWRHAENDFKAWCLGQTGFPIVDAGMRELNSTGFMHNRVRMIVSSFLVKDLLIDWRWGEAYFARKLNDFDLSANNGGWQWAAGSGCDAAPYFRVFNPSEQQKKFDPDLVYIKRWIPEYGTPEYPEPMVDHAIARKRALEVYKTALTAHRQLKIF